MKKKLFKNNKIGIADVFSKCKRKNKESSKDTNLIIVEYNNLIANIFQHIGAFISYTNNSYFFKTNLFNFIIFAAIIIYICIKLNLKTKLEQAKENVDSVIHESETVMEESATKLDEMEKAISNIAQDVDEILNTSNKNAELVGEKILEDAKKTALIIKDNTEKAIENSVNILRNDLITRATEASLEVAKSRIINELNNNKDLHNRLIDESVNSLEGVDL